MHEKRTPFSPAGPIVAISKSSPRSFFIAGSHSSDPMPQYFEASRSSTVSSSMIEIDRLRGDAGHDHHIVAGELEGRAQMAAHVGIAVAVGHGGDRAELDLGARRDEAAAHDPGGHDEEILRTEGIGVAGNLVVENLGDHAAPSEPFAHQLLVGGMSLDPAGREVDAQRRAGQPVGALGALALFCALCTL